MISMRNRTVPRNANQLYATSQVVGYNHEEYDTFSGGLLSQLLPPRIRVEQPQPVSVVL